MQIVRHVIQLLGDEVRGAPFIAQHLFHHLDFLFQDVSVHRFPFKVFLSFGRAGAAQIFRGLDNLLCNVR